MTDKKPLEQRIEETEQALNAEKRKEIEKEVEAKVRKEYEKRLGSERARIEREVKNEYKERGKATINSEVERRLNYEREKIEEKVRKEYEEKEKSYEFPTIDLDQDVETGIEETRVDSSKLFPSDFQTRRKRRKWPWLLGVGGLVTVITILIATSGTHSGNESSRRATSPGQKSYNSWKSGGENERNETPTTQNITNLNPRFTSVGGSVYFVANSARGPVQVDLELFSKVIGVSEENGVAIGKYVSKINDNLDYIWTVTIDGRTGAYSRQMTKEYH